jgi:hypothetical protein
MKELVIIGAGPRAAAIAALSASCREILGLGKGSQCRDQPLYIIVDHRQCIHFDHSKTHLALSIQ